MSGTKGNGTDDPRITAYALGQMAAEEAKQFELEIAADPQLLQAIAEVREVGALLGEGFSREPTVELSAKQRKRVAAASMQPQTRPRMLRISVAAAVLVGASLATGLLLKQSGAFRSNAAPDAIRSANAGPESSPSTSATTPLNSDFDSFATPNKTVDFATLSRDQPAVELPRTSTATTGQDDFFMGGSRRVAASRRFTAPDQPAGSPSTGAFLNSINREDVRGKAENFFGAKLAPDLGDGETYDHFIENEFASVMDAPLSTFSIDVDTASYANVRRFLKNGALPPVDAVRIEELVNYFSYQYPGPGDEQPFSISLEVASCPWAPEHRLARVGLRGREIEVTGDQVRNLVFLIDVSGSMSSQHKLPLLKRSMQMLVDNLREHDRIAIVTYAGASGCVLEPTFCEKKADILAAIDELAPAGSTNGAAGIHLAYHLAAKHFDPTGINRVILATDGDFNVGVSSAGELTRLIEEKRETGVFLSVLGFGTGNLQDAKMESLADHGNGNYSYIDSLSEARKVLVHEMGATLVTIAKDVKVQVEFNPTEVGAYRLIGYENRMLATQDFNDDKKDAGEIGAGHRVTALYEIVPAGSPLASPAVDPLKYQKPATPLASSSDDLMTVKLRYKEPNGSKSMLVERSLVDAKQEFVAASTDFRFAAAVASFGMILRNSKFAGSATLDAARHIAARSLGSDRFGYRGEFLELIDLAAKKRGQ